MQNTREALFFRTALPYRLLLLLADCVVFKFGSQRVEEMLLKLR